MSLTYSGERIIPGKVEHHLEVEHITRYMSVEGQLRNGGKKILDAGCGTGYGSVMLAKIGNFVYGIDIDYDSIRYAHEKYSCENLRFLRADCNNYLPFPSNSFDAVICFEVIEHLAQYKLFLKEVKRVLTSEGFLYLSTPNKRVYTDSRNFHNPYHVHEFYPKELQELLCQYYEHVTLLGQIYMRGVYIGTSKENHNNTIDTVWALDETDPVISDENFLQEAEYILAVCKKTHLVEVTIGNLMLIASSVLKSHE